MAGLWVLQLAQAWEREREMAKGQWSERGSKTQLVRPLVL